MKDWKKLNTDRYYEYIKRIIEERGQWADIGEIREGHHIILKSYGGNGRTRSKHENIIWLYAREHFEVHKILAEDNPDEISVVSAWSMMAFPKSSTQKRNFPITEEEYEKLRSMFGRLRRGVVVSDVTRKRLSAALTGKHPKRTKEHNQKISESNKHSHNISPEGLAVLKSNSRRYHDSLTEDQKREYAEKQRQRIIGTRWFTNGIVDVRRRLCPEGFVSGRSKRRKINFERNIS